MIRMVLFRTTSNFLVCLLRHHAGAEYSAALYTTAKALVRSIEVFAPQEVPARYLSRLFLAEILERKPSRC